MKFMYNSRRINQAQRQYSPAKPYYAVLQKHACVYAPTLGSTR